MSTTITTAAPRLPSKLMPISTPQPNLTADNLVSVGRTPPTKKPRTRSRGSSGASTDPSEEWARLFHAAERRKVQNRNAQRKYRQSLKKRLESLESQGAHMSPISASKSSASSSSTTSRPSLRRASGTRSPSYGSSATTLSSFDECEQQKLDMSCSFGQEPIPLPNWMPGHQHRWSTSNIPDGPNMMLSLLSSGDSFDSSLPRYDPTPLTVPLHSDSFDLLDQTTFSSTFDTYPSTNIGLGIVEPTETNTMSGDFLQIQSQLQPSSVQSTPCLSRSRSPFVPPVGVSPIHLAAMRGFDSIIRLLLEQGANVNEADERGCTALHIAIENGHQEAVKILLEHGADLTTKVQ